MIKRKKYLVTNGQFDPRAVLIWLSELLLLALSLHLWSQLSLLKCTAVSWAHLYYLIWGTCLKIYCICLHLLSFYLSNQFLSRFSETFGKNCLVLLYQVLSLFWILFFCWFVPISMHVLLLFFFFFITNNLTSLSFSLVHSKYHQAKYFG